MYLDIVDVQKMYPVQNCFSKIKHDEEYFFIEH